MKVQENPKIVEIIEKEQAALFLEKRDSLTDRIRESIGGIQAENRRAYNRRRKKATC